MPRIIRGTETLHHRHPELIAELAAELIADRVSGQPVIEEQHFSEGDAIRVTVIWDKWDDVDDDDRIATILQAYEQVEGGEFRERIALAVGLTVPEASALGVLPIRIMSAVREGDRA